MRYFVNLTYDQYQEYRSKSGNIGVSGLITELYDLKRTHFIGTFLMDEELCHIYCIILKSDDLLELFILRSGLRILKNRKAVEYGIY